MIRVCVMSLVLMVFYGCTKQSNESVAEESNESAIKQEAGLLFRNEYAYDANVTITYVGGEVEKTVWPSCERAVLGKEGEVIESVNVISQGHPEQNFVTADITRFSEFEKREGVSIWIISKSGIWPSKAQECTLSD